MLLWCQHSALMWTSSSCRTIIHPGISWETRWDATFISKFSLFKNKGIELDFGHCILDFVFIFYSVVMPCRFFKNTLRDLVFTIMQKETCFSYFWILWKSSENFRNSLQCFYQWKEWEANIMFFPPHCVLSVAWVCVSVCICVCVCLISVVFSKFESLTFKYMCVFF